ncbi:MAG TPA: hypothetical protein VL460_02105 [Caulobacteraceae bacterium]|jgi:hypothetical protein|nr:hypothetical protein [Caulobacteraceae bacterium]
MAEPYSAPAFPAAAAPGPSLLWGGWTWWARMAGLYLEGLADLTKAQTDLSKATVEALGFWRADAFLPRPKNAELLVAGTQAERFAEGLMLTVDAFAATDAGPRVAPLPLPE